MALQPRKLLSELCLSYCVNSNESALCPSSCLSLCPEFCKYPLFSDPPSSDSYSYPPPDPLHQKLSLSLTWDIFIALIAATILAVAAYALFLKRRRRRRRADQPQSEETHDEFLDQDHGPVVEHHIWYINTVGLQQSLIDSIAVCKYKTGEGLVEGTECSVCLSEFREDETLRLLPKCSHAFHVPCIDTWLRSHTNCPVCRAPVMSNGSSTEAVESLVAGEETQDLESNGEGEEQETRTEEGGEMETENRKEDETQTSRRSVSLDSSSALKIDLALANVSPEESEIDRNLNSGLVKSSAETGENRVVTNQSLLRVMRAGSSSSSSMKRSLSCSGKLFLSRNSRSRSRSMNLPL